MVMWSCAEGYDNGLIQSVIKAQLSLCNKLKINGNYVVAVCPSRTE